MSAKMTQDVKCPCGEEFEAELWSSVNVRQDPDLREVVLAGRLNVVLCPRCGKALYAERLVLYHDPEASLLAFVYPYDLHKESARWKEKAAEDFKEAQEPLPQKERLSYLPEVLFGLDRLVELLEREQEEADQGMILEALSGPAAVGVRRIPVSRARAEKVPALLPYVEDAGLPPREALREGVRRVLAANDRLSVYAELAKRLTFENWDAARLLADE
jgi:hypothetical protein